MNRALVLGAVFAVAGPAAAFDREYTGLAQVLKGRVRGGSVDYAGLKKDRAGLDAWLDAAAQVESSEFAGWPAEDRLALLINVYNATTLRLIVDHYPVSSIKKIGPVWDPNKAWRLPVVRLFGRTMTLDDLEHRNIRPGYREPRAHFALVCAAKGCPPLRPEPYLGPRLAAQLDDQGRAFLSRREKNRADPEAGRAYLSPIFKWYMEDFGGSKEAVLDFVDKWLPVGRSWDVEWTVYDWSLNEARG